MSPTSLKKKGELKSLQLAQCRSPSMWEKLEKWKAEKKKTATKTTARQPFIAGPSKTKRCKAPSKASEKMQILAESNRKTTWNCDTLPRHLNYRKSLHSVAKHQKTRKKLHGRETEKGRSVQRTGRKIRRETLTLSVGKKTAQVGNHCADQDKQSAVKPEETLSPSVGKMSEKQLGRKRKLEDEDEEDLRAALQVKPEIKHQSSAHIVPQRVTRQTEVHDKGPQKVGSSTSNTSQMATPNIGQKAQLQASSRRRSQKRMCAASLGSSGLARKSLVPTREQSNMRTKLQQWLIAKGRTPTHTANLMKTPRLGSKKGVNEESVVQCNGVLTVEEAMDACKNLLNEGCPSEYLSDWLEIMQAKLPCLGEMEPFLECKATILESAISHPVDTPFPAAAADESMGHDTAKSHQVCLDEEKPEVTKTPNDTKTPSRRKSRRSSFQLLSPVGELEESFSVKYQVREATPYFKRIQEALGHISDTPSAVIVTPVRRSIRLSKRKSVSFASRPAEGRPADDACIDSLDQLDELSLEQPIQLVLRSNRALEGEFSLAEEVRDRST